MHLRSSAAEPSQTFARLRQLIPGVPRRRFAMATAAVAAVAIAGAGVVATSPAVTAAKPPAPAAQAWVATWASVQTSVPAKSLTTLENQTVRQVVHTSVGGDCLRLRLSNEFGDQPLVIGAADVALRAKGGTGTDIAPATDRPVTFAGHREVTVPPGAPMVSDPIALRLPAAADLVVSLYLPQRTPVTTVHGYSIQNNVVAAGNVTSAGTVTATTTMTQWYFLSGVSVLSKPGPAEADAGSIVTFGDSITDGYNTEIGANHRWPDLLANRLRDGRGHEDQGVANLAITGNRLLHDPDPPAGTDAEGFAGYFGQSALRRFDRDVLTQPSARYLLVLLGINDIGQPGTSVAPASDAATAEQIIDAHRQLIARAHQAGLKAYGATLTPFMGDTLGFSSAQGEAKRQAVNLWIRTSREYDGFVDFDAAVRDPAQPDHLLAAYDSGDHLHPSDAGAAAMAAAIPLSLFR